MSPAIEQLLDADPIPHAIVDPARRYVLLVHERRLLPIERLARPAIELAGQRVDLDTFALHGQHDYHALTIVDLLTAERREIELPRGAVISYPSWAPNGSRFAFVLTRASGAELWIGEPQEARARPLADSLNAVHGPSCDWTPDSRRLLCRVIATSRSASQPTLAKLARAVERLQQQPRIGQPILVEPEVAATLLESRLMLIDSLSGQRHTIGAAAAYDGASVSPAGAFLLVSRMQRPYPIISGVDVVSRVHELWDRTGKLVTTLPKDARAIGWLPGAPATVVWIESVHGLDHVMTLAPPYDEPAISRFVVPHRFAGLRWLGSTHVALISDYDAAVRATDLWHVDLAGVGEAEAARVLRYNRASMMTPLMALNERGVMAAVQYDDGFYVQGTSSSEQNTTSFLDFVSIEGSESRRVWQESSPDRREEVVSLLSNDASRLLIREEGYAAPANYWIKQSDGRRIAALGENRPLLPALTEARVVELNYQRDDGLPLRAALHLPPGYEGSAPLPMILWAYPQYVGSGETVTSESAASRLSRLMTFERGFRSFYLLHGYAVLDEVAMPIVGADADANDTFVDQVIANARAAIVAAVATGAVDPTRVGVAGHSYGAFMVANLLAHSDLFAVGAALSGAYNRTLTPFGFQTERRTLWQAPETYFAMSPLLYSHQIQAPLLLVHGLNDDNAGTSPLQSTQFYEAIRGNQGDVKLLLLPWEGHTYRARESVQKTAVEMLDWFDRYLKPPSWAKNKNGRIPAPEEEL